MGAAPDLEKKLNVAAGATDGEALVRRAVQSLTDDYKVFYHPQLNSKAEVDPYDRALDIVVVHRTKGLLAISTKFGEITEEQNGLINQYQPRRAIYKIMDPSRQAKAALQEMLNAFDPSWGDSLPIGAAVFLPDTAQKEFYDPKSIFFFKEDMGGMQFQAKLDVLFPYPFDSTTQAKMEAAYVLLCNNLKQYSASENPFANRSARIKNFTEAKKRKPPNLRTVKPVEMPMALVGEGKPELKIVTAEAVPLVKNEQQASKPPKIDVELVKEEKPLFAKPVSFASPQDELAEQAKRALSARRHQPAQSELGGQDENFPLLAFFNRMENALHITQDANVVMSPAQWAIAFIGGTALICACYFGFHNLGLALGL